MTISYDSYQEPQPKISQKKATKHLFSLLRIEDKDLPFAIGAIALALYFGFSDPILMITLMASIFIAGSLYFLISCLPLISKKFKVRVSIWHLLTVVFGLTLALNAWEPSHALFLTGLEDAVVDLVGKGGVGSISADQIGTLFSFIRIALILVAIGGGFAAWQQQQQGQSMTPIIMFVGGLFGIVLAIDILTAVIVTGT